MTTDRQPGPTHPRLLYPLIALVALGLAFDMTVTNKVFPAPETVAAVDVIAGPEILTEHGEVVQGRYRFAAAFLVVEAALALLWMVATSPREKQSYVVVGRSPLRLYAYAALAVPAIFMAIDLTRTNHFAPPPETSSQVVGQRVDEEGATVDVTQQVLTEAGRSERRRDVLLSVFLFVGGAAALAWAGKEMVVPMPFLVAGDEGLLIRVDGPGRPPRRYGWDGIVEVRSGLLEEDGVEVPVLSIRFLDIEDVPYLPAAARAEPPWLHLYSDEWDVPAHHIAPFLDQYAARPRPLGGYE